MEQENLMAGGGGLAARDLVTTGIFSALYLVFMMVGGMFFASNPVLTFWMPAASALLTGPVYLLLVAKVPKHGPLVVLGVVEGLVVFATGMYWGWSVACVVLGVVADVVAGVGGFRNKALNLVAFVVYSLSPMGSYLMLWVDPSGYASYLVGKGAEQAYMDTMFSTATSWMLPAMLVATVACAVVSGLVGMRLLRRQFAKAGMTA
ncbi:MULTISPECIES: MptD family putative ECF transporter S component [Olsenella]|uniref:MptD family putative ECF transporter S component n=1 Tax=Olsenella TaxID=133925 RepID=UPI000231EDD4|nr:MULTISPECIES: MptD family putative ECF transporter S component [Olsenella]EHF02105.1 hypothetical protein HMPREF1008_01035 [Olsenella sp. oral taxon 809 str. F0356]